MKNGFHSTFKRLVRRRYIHVARKLEETFHGPDSGFTRATASPGPHVHAVVQASTPAMPSPQAGSGAPSPAAILGPVPRLTPVVEGTAPASVPGAWPWLAVILVLATALVVVVGLRLRREADLGREL